MPNKQPRTIEKQIKVCELIAADMESDVKTFEGKPLDGRTMGEMHGNLCAAISELADLIKEHLQSHV